MKFAFIKAHLGFAAGWTIGVLCRIIGVTRSGFYAWLKAKRRSATTTQLTRRARRKRVAEIFEQHKHRYGAPRIHAQLVKEGITCDVKTVASDMKSMGRFALQNKAFRVTTPTAITAIRQKHSLTRPTRPS